MNIYFVENRYLTILLTLILFAFANLRMFFSINNSFSRYYYYKYYFINISHLKRYRAMHLMGKQRTENIFQTFMSLKI